jgi:hypothetical protein
MFVGTINPAIRKYFIDRRASFRGRTVVVGCSGNFSVEATLSALGVARAIHSNDVSFYTTMLGRWLTGQPLEFQLQPEWAWLEPWMHNDDDRAALVVQLSGLIRYVKATMNAHNARFLAAYREQMAVLIPQTREKCLRVRDGLALAGYYAGDVREHYRQHENDPDALFLCFAPTYKGGYENLWKPLHKIVAWDEPVYGMIDDEAREQMMRWLAGRRFIWMDDRDLRESMGWEPEFAVEIGRARTQYLYSNALDEPGFVGKRSTVKDPRLPICRAIREDSVVTVERVEGEVFAFYRENYLAKSIAPAPPAWAWVVKVDGAVAGAFGMTQPRFGERDGVYMLSDFGVGNPSPHPRVSKLVVMMALSEEVRTQIERARMLPTRTVTTTAFTRKPVSMKYRGLLEVKKRGDGFLNYEGEFSGQRAQIQFRLWWQRFGRGG